MSFGVIFDMDGVMVLTEEAHWRSWQQIALRRGIELTLEAFRSTFGQVNADCIPAMFGSGLSPDEILRIGDEKERAFRDIIGANVPLAPGLIALLDDLRRAGSLLAVGSSAPPENVALVLDGGGIRDHFDALVDGTQVERGKPAPDVFLRAAERLGLPPARCVVLEDAPSGILAARAAGMKAIGVATTHAPESLREAGADAVVPDVEHLERSLVLDLLEPRATR
jgi:beta-phosphoglucomutase